MIFVDGEGAGDEESSKQRGVCDDELPEGWVVVGEDFEFGVEVVVPEILLASARSGGRGRDYGRGHIQVQEAGPGSS